MYSPRLLLMDEPLSSLDDRLKQQILPFLKRVKDETRIPMLYVGHSRPEVDYLADRVLTMEGGRLDTPDISR
jgi:molybdate transport system ATP-binding protein